LTIGSGSDDDLPGRAVHLAGRGTTYVREAGGPPGAPTVILLHGLGATAGTNWAAVSAALRARFHVVAPDQRGHGRGIRTSRFRLEDCADDVAALAEHLGVRRAVIVGYSMGGPVASLVWRRHPGLVDGLVLLATSDVFRGNPAERLGYGALAALVATIAPRMPGSAKAQSVAVEALQRAPVVGRPMQRLLWRTGEIAHNDPRSMLQAADQLGRFNSRSWISEVDVPTAVVATTEDRFVATARQVGLAMTIPSAVLHPIAAGHMGVFDSRGGAAADAVLDACEQVVRRARRATV